MDVDVAGETAAEDVLAQEAGCSSPRRCLAAVGCRLFVAAPDEDEGMPAADGVSGQGHPLDQGVRVVFQKDPVLVGSGLHLVAVADQPARPRQVARHERPLLARSESRRRRARAGWSRSPSAAPRRATSPEAPSSGRKSPFGAILVKGHRPAGPVMSEKKLFHRTLSLCARCCAQVKSSFNTTALLCSGSFAAKRRVISPLLPSVPEPFQQTLMNPQFHQIALPEFRPFLGIMREPLPQFTARGNLLEPLGDPCLVPGESAWPQPVDQNAFPVRREPEDRIPALSLPWLPPVSGSSQQRPPAAAPARHDLT